MATRELPYNPRREASQEVEQFINDSTQFSIDGFLELFVRIETRRVYYPVSFEDEGPNDDVVWAHIAYDFSERMKEIRTDTDGDHYARNFDYLLMGHVRTSYSWRRNGPANEWSLYRRSIPPPLSGDRPMLALPAVEARKDKIFGDPKVLYDPTRKPSEMRQSNEVDQWISRCNTLREQMAEKAASRHAPRPLPAPPKGTSLVTVSYTHLTLPTKRIV